MKDSWTQYVIFTNIQNFTNYGWVFSFGTLACLNKFILLETQYGKNNYKKSEKC